MVAAAALTFLSPWAALVALPALAAGAGVALGHRRVERVRQALTLPEAGRSSARMRLGLAAAIAAALGVTAAQPALTREQHARVRRDVQVLFVLDTSRSMAASGSARTATRLARASNAAAGLRAAIPEVAAGIATITDRVLPDLLPVPDHVGFDGVLKRSVAIESPPPRNGGVRATSYDALAQIPGNGYFDPQAQKRIVVVLTDGESLPVQTDEIAQEFAADGRYQLELVRFWAAGEAIYDADGRREAAYRPDPAGGATLSSLAASLGASVFDERALGAARTKLAQLVGTGPTHDAAGSIATRTPLGPYTAALALLAILGLVARLRPSGAPA